jgi:excinuclease UvrABC nuclease subunit
MTTRCYLYRHFTAGGDLLYVGLSVNPFQRLRQHRDASRWFDQVRHVEIVALKDVATAVVVEAISIALYKPPFNTVGFDRKYLRKEWRRKRTIRLARIARAALRQKIQEQQGDKWERKSQRPS